MRRGDRMKRVLGLLLVLATASGAAHAADDRAATKKPPAPVVRERPDFKLDFSGGPSSSNSPAPPPGTSTLRRDDDGAMPFLGLKLSKPLGG